MKNTGNKSKDEYIYDVQPFGTFSYDRDGVYDAGLFGVFAKMLKDKKNIIDVGCGEGYILGYLHRKGIDKRRLTGVDLGKRAVEHCKKNGFHSFIADNKKLNFSKTYDAVISNGVIHHTGAYEQSFHELARITKRHGIIFLSVYNAIHPYYPLYVFTKPIRWLYEKKGFWRKFVFFVFAPIFRWLYFVPLFIIFTRRVIDRHTALTLFYDQILTPIAEFRTKSQVEQLVKSAKCTIIESRVERGGGMVGVICRKS